MASKGKIEAGARAMRSAFLKRGQVNTEFMSWDDIYSARKEAYLEDAEACIDAAEFVAGEEKIKAGAQALHASAVKRARRNGNELAPWEVMPLKYIGIPEDTLNKLDAILIPRVNAGYARNDDPATAPVQVDPVRGFDPAEVTAPANQATFGGGADPFSQIISGAMSVLSQGSKG